MSKVVSAINAMIENKEYLGNVRRKGNELYFTYKDKHKWSIHRSSDEVFTLHYYPMDFSIDYLSNLADYEWAELDGQFVTYSTKELKSREALETFRELYVLLQEKVLGIDNVLDEIIGDIEGIF